MFDSFDSIEAVRDALADRGYFADPDLSTCLLLAWKMEKAVLLEGEPGVGKTDVARVLSEILGAPLVRLQCYEGLDPTQAVYEWDYPRQLLAIEVRSGNGGSGHGAGEATASLFSEDYLLRRPLLQAIDRCGEQAPVLLIDEIDRADEEFDAFLFELLDEFQITIPELGTYRAENRPVTIVTSNGTREIYDALKRRCIYQWIDYPERDRELEILRRKVPETPEALTRRIVDFVQRLRQLDLYRRPGVSESLDWARALTHLGVDHLDGALVDRTLGCLLKTQEDVEAVRGPRAAALLAETGGE